MKKLVTALLVFTLMLSLAGSAFAATDPNTLVVGTPSMNGDFVWGFGNSAYDAAIKRLVHNFMATVETTPANEFVINPTVIKDYDVVVDEAGNKTYTWTIWEDLKWSDGSAITAKDYVFQKLYFASPAWVEAGASSGDEGYGLVGYKAYNKGETDVFAGMKLLDEFTFSMTIDAEELPYFYEITYASCMPAPMAVYAPGCDIVSDENGSKVEGDLLSGLLNVAQVERFAPSIGCGPYKFIKFENQSAFLEINEHFKGTFEGKKPSIPYIEQRFVPQDQDVYIMIAGDLDLVGGVIEGAKIEAAKEAENAKTHSYLRAGYGYYAMHCDFGPVADPNVRWAMGYLIDRNACVDYVLSGYGGVVQAEYGYAQWMYQEAGAELEELLTPFNLNIEKANECLDLTEWVFEADGSTPFDASKANEEGTYLRHNAAGEPLAIHHLGTVDNSVTDIIEIQFAANTPLAGIVFDVIRGDFNMLLDNYYYGYEMGDDRYFNSFNLATSFTGPFDPYFSSWHSEFVGSWENSCQLGDAELDEYIMGMRSLEADQKDEFVDYWLKYEKRWQELLPQIPLYSNEYFVCYGEALDGVENITPYAPYEYVICDITKNAE